MSIIYDSLKKVEGKIDSNDAPAMQPKPVQKPRFSVVSYVCYGVALCLGIVAASMFFRVFNHAALSPRQASARIKVPQPVVKPKADAPLKSSPLEPAQGQFSAKEAPEEQAAENPSFVLNGVFSSQDGDYALVNNQIVKVGDMVGGAKVVRITSEGVQLELNGGPITLTTRRK